MKKLILSFISVLASVCGYAQGMHDIWNMHIEEVDGIVYGFYDDSNEAEVISRGDINPYKEDIVIPESFKISGRTYNVTSIGRMAFYYTPEMTSVTLPNTIKEIKERAFHNMHNNITSIAIPNSVEKIGGAAFSDNSEKFEVKFDADNKNFIFEDGMILTYDRKTLVNVVINKYYYTIPNTVTTLASGAFNYFANIFEIKLPSSLTTIEEDVFYGASTPKLEMNIPENVSHIAEGAFSHSISFMDLTVDPKNKHYVCENGLLMDADKTIVLANEQRAEFILPESVTKIGKYTFNLDETSPKELTIPNNVEYIGKNAFRGCSELETLTIGSSVKIMDVTNFLESYKLTSIVSLAVTPPNPSREDGLYDSYFPYVLETATLTVPKGSLEAYKNNSYWGKFFNIIEAGDNPSGISSVTDNGSNEPASVYSIDGSRIQTMQRGINIIRMQDGSVKKVLKK